MEDDALERLKEEPFLEELEEEDLLEMEAFVPANEAEMERLAARDSSNGAREEDVDADECRDGMFADSMSGFREGTVGCYADVQDAELSLARMRLGTLRASDNTGPVRAARATCRGRQ